MPYDAAMLRFVVHEMNERLTGGRVDKIYQPSRDEVIFIIRAGGKDHRLYINAGSGARMNITSQKPENPTTPPMFCMMLRKHFQGAKIAGITQLGFERAARISFDAADDLSLNQSLTAGVTVRKHIICELMGRFSNIIITNSEDRIVGVLKSIDFTTSEKRQVLSGMTYELPPKQDKLDPLDLSIDEKAFKKLAADCERDKSAEKFIMSSFAGLSPLIAREIVFRAAGKTDATMQEAARELWNKFDSVITSIKACEGKSCLIRNSEGEPIEYSFMEIRQYGGNAVREETESCEDAIDAYFEERSRNERLHRRAADIFKLLQNAEARITKKTGLQREELEACEEGEKYRLWGDLITANIYKLKRGMTECTVQNYMSEDYEEITIPLDKRLAPSQNAQSYYKKYNKSKAAKSHLTEQLAAAEDELSYVYSVLDSLTRADGEKELAEIRAELYHSGYASRMKNYTEKKQTAPSIARYVTSEGYTVLCGRNNIANDYLTTKLAERSDWWFHVKNQPGSHVVLNCKDGEDEPTEKAFTEAAEIAAYNSKARGGVMIPVDYMKVSKVKKPAGAKPGLVVYTTNWTAYVTPDDEKIEKMKQK